LILWADSIGKRFDERYVLSAGTLQVERGQIVGLVGRMGTGKSTLLKICAGVMRADHGWVQFDGVRYQRPHLSGLARRGLMYIGERDFLPFRLSIGHQLREISETFRLQGRSDVIERFQLQGLLNVRPPSLSTGERRRVELAMAALRQPRCLLVDEPFRGLDPITAASIRESLRDLAATGAAIVVTGHELQTIITFATAITWVVAGTTYHLGTPATAVQHVEFSREYLGSGVVHPVTVV